MSGMSKETLFVRGNGQNSDALDDALLLSSYDKHFNSVKKKVLRRMGYTNSEIDDVLKTGDKQKKKKKVPKQAPKWSVGARCCSVFSEDGNVYEATITRLHSDRETCCVQYIGYNNEEEVPLSSLTPSQGHKAREAQLLAAGGGEVSNMEYSENYSEDDSVQVISQQKGKSSRNNKQKRMQQMPPHAFSMNMPQFPPPPNLNMPQLNGMPPVMPSIVPPMPFNMIENSEQTEAFSAMLMSWYMSGYYTGYYEALNARRRQNNKK